MHEKKLSAKRFRSPRKIPFYSTMKSESKLLLFVRLGFFSSVFSAEQVLPKGLFRCLKGVQLWVLS
jgi:hypothetical protein